MKNLFFKVLPLIVCGIFLLGFNAKAAGVTWPPDSGLPTGSLSTVISNFTKWLLGIFGFLAIISFVVTGIMYLMSAGDDKQQEKAKSQLQWSIVGVAVGLIGLIVIYAVDSLLRGSS
jgi:hypothetical protein